jgi:uncharacterized protein (DUF58 family)
MTPRPRRRKRQRAPGEAGPLSAAAVLSASDRLKAATSRSVVRDRIQQLERQLGLTRSGQVAVVAAIGIWIAARLVAGTAMYLFAYGAVLLIVISLCVAPRKLRLTGERTGLFPRAREGDRLDVEVTLTAGRRVSTFILEERVPERLGREVRVPITRLSPGGTVRHHYSLRCQRRGVYEVGPLVAVASDPLGLAERETRLAEPFELLVHPRLEVVTDRPLTRQYEDPPVRPPVSKPWPSGFEFFGMREFKPGDDLRRIVWRASARTGTIMVREAEQGITDRITIALDTNRAHHSSDGEGYSESFEAGVRTAASLAVHHLRQGYEVKVECNGGSLTRSIRGATAQLPMLDAFARLEMDRQPLSAAIRRLLHGGRRDAHNILITPGFGPDEAAQLRILLDTGASVLVVALLWDEEDDGIVGLAAGLGCQVVAVHPGQDLSSALSQDIGAGNRL